SYVKETLMNSRTIACTFILLFTSAVTGFGQTPTAADVSGLRSQIDALKADYEARITALETQLKALQSQLQTTPAAEAPTPQPGAVPAVSPQAAQTVQVPSGAQGAGGPGGTLPLYGGGGGGDSKAFNPDIAVIGDFLSAAGSKKVNP